MPEGTEALEVGDEIVDGELPETPSGEGDDGNADGDGTPPPEGEERPEPGTKAWADLEKKYPGLSEEELRQKVALQYWDQTRTLSKVSKERRELELRVARLEGRLEAGTTPEKEEPEPPPPEVEELDRYIHGLTERDQQVSDAQVQTLKTLNDAKEKVGEVKGLIQAAKQANDEDKVSRLEGRLETAEARVEGLRDKLDATVRERKDIAYNVGKAKQERTWYEKLAKEGKAKQEAEEADLQEQYEEAPRIVNAQITEVMNDSGMPADPAMRQDLRETLQDKITVDLWKAGRRGLSFAKIDVHGLLKQHTEKYMKAHGIAKRADFQRRSEERTRTVTPASRPAATPAQPTKKITVVSGVGALPPGMLRGRRLLSGKGW
jgi:hypothetical protein